MKFVQFTVKTLERRQMMSFCCLYCFFWTDFSNYSGVFVVVFKQVNTARCIPISQVYQEVETEIYWFISGETYQQAASGNEQLEE